jgi:hypothetical protein
MYPLLHTHIYIFDYIDVRIATMYSIKKGLKTHCITVLDSKLDKFIDALKQTIVNKLFHHFSVYILPDLSKVIATKC